MALVSSQHSARDPTRSYLSSQMHRTPPHPRQSRRCCLRSSAQHRSHRLVSSNTPSLSSPSRPSSFLAIIWARTISRMLLYWLFQVSLQRVKTLSRQTQTKIDLLMRKRKSASSWSMLYSERRTRYTNCMQNLSKICLTIYLQLVIDLRGNGGDTIDVGLQLFK
jgi:hypothetical protein